eukprot:12064754-Ditylum_brightwellii.AAC.1
MLTSQCQQLPTFIPQLDCAGVGKKRRGSRYEELYRIRSTNRDRTIQLWDELAFFRISEAKSGRFR